MSEIRSEPLADAHTPVTPETSDEASRDVAGSRRPHWLPFLGLAAVVAIADQLAKAWLVSVLEPGRSMPVLGDWLRLVHAQNTGGLFGLLGGQATIFGVVSIVVVGLIVVYHGRARPNRYLSITLGLLLGGAVGNLIDRVRLGYVVDFVDMGIGTLRFYTYNVADAAISTSIVLLLAASLWPALARRTGIDA